ncbi:Hypothetical predicted protein [Podarcis lilfordi]|uniref:Uncharacterized protein n=1 Tax=Podarcis lilfordi TaxID=74358 RepID=A0AA35PE81_9SAUR|nr:Hypothetical predicted protein [Podarcis lilfordi]
MAAGTIWLPSNSTAASDAFRASTFRVKESSPQSKRWSAEATSPPQGECCACDQIARTYVARDKPRRYHKPPSLRAAQPPKKPPPASNGHKAQIPRDRDLK